MLLRAVAIVLVVTTCVYGLPQQKEEQPGPCVGMDCLHGVLMHNDEEQGDVHKTEDQYLRFKEALDTGSPPEIGTKATEDDLHNMLMHGGENEHHEDGGDVLPEINVEKGPRDPNEFLHEAMHGEEGVMKHDWDKNEDIPVQHEPMDGEKFMHNVLMHGGTDHVDDPMETDTGNNQEPIGPYGGDRLMDGLLMHGDEHHTHESEGEVEDTNRGKIQPIDLETQLHGLLMHGDTEPGIEHEHEHTEKTENVEGSRPPGPSGADLHGILMHGDSEYGKDHSHEDSSDSSKTEVFSDILEILNMDLDEELLKVINIEKLLKKDMDEYAEWIKNNPSYQDESMSGSTNIGVTDSLLTDIEQMKNRYLKEQNNDPEIPETIDEYPFTAEDANEILKPDAMERSKDEDMRHWIELVGSTEPLNARHKVQLAILKAKLDQDD